MATETNDPDVEARPIRDARPGLTAGLGSIVAGVIGFCVPVVGMIASCAGIYLGVKAIRRGRASRDRTNLACGVTGTTLSGLGIVFWVIVILFESYR